MSFLSLDLNISNKIIYVDKSATEQIKQMGIPVEKSVASIVEPVVTTVESIPFDPSDR